MHTCTDLNRVLYIGTMQYVFITSTKHHLAYRVSKKPSSLSAISRFNEVNIEFGRIMIYTVISDYLVRLSNKTPINPCLLTNWLGLLVWETFG